MPPSQPAETTLQWVVSAHEHGLRLEQFIKAHAQHLMRKDVSRWISQNRVSVNAKIVSKPGYRLSAHDAVQIYASQQISSVFNIETNPNLPIDVLFEDDVLVVINKPPFQAVHPLRLHEKNTLANGLLARYPEMQEVGFRSREPGLLHRLDNNTSGLLIAVRDQSAFDTLKRSQERGDIQKVYLALCTGTIKTPQNIDLPLRTDPKNSKIVMAGSPHDLLKPWIKSHTEILSAQGYGDMSLLSVRITQGTRHQIRAHLAAIGHPIAGDSLYGGPSLPELNRQFLHAHRLTFQHPVSNQTLTFESALPADLTLILEWLTVTYGSDDTIAKPIGIPNP